MPIHLITSNPNKLVELKAVFPSDLSLMSTELDLDEIQTLDLRKIVKHKLLQAYKEVGEPVIVEDVSTELENLNGLPGPFIKFFEQKLGKGALYKLSDKGTPVIIRCIMGYYDGKNEHIVEGILNGSISEPKGEQGFGFDFVIIPAGYTKTMSELGQELKNTISHRYLAAKQMSEYLANLR